MTEQEAISVVLRDGKRTCIYCDEYMNLPQDIGKYKYIILKDYCKQQGSKDVREWLIAKGLYLDIERDMREENVHIDWQASVEIFCAQILDVFPLAGEPVFPDEARTKLFRRAQEIFDTIVSGIAENEKKDLSDGECDVITIAIVQHIQRRDLQEGSESDTPFWSYIYSQFGFNPDNDPTNTQRIYGVFCRAVQKAFSRHHRFFSSGKETQKYYTSLMLHALMPAQSMESLFEILRFFYVKDLEFTYTPEDSIFKALVDCMATRWDKDIELQRELQLPEYP